MPCWSNPVRPERLVEEVRRLLAQSGQSFANFRIRMIGRTVEGVTMARNLAGQPEQQPKHPRREIAESIKNGRDQHNDPQDAQRNVRTDPSPDQVAQRAYGLYRERGGEHGHDLDDWF